MAHEALEWLALGDESLAVKKAGEEAGVEEMEDGVLDAADVDIHREAPRGHGGLESFSVLLVGRAKIAEEIPACA